MAIGVWEIVALLVIVLLVFGAGWLPRVMGRLGGTLGDTRRRYRQRTGGGLRGRPDANDGEDDQDRRS